jgi:hypothetical protein
MITVARHLFVFLLLSLAWTPSAGAQAERERNVDSVAVVIGNSDYQRTPDVSYAIEDARRVKAFLIEVLGYREQNIIYRENATAGQMLDIFGDDKTPNGELWSLITPGKSDVFVFYSGHGVPVSVDGQPGVTRAHLLPVDVAASNAHRGVAVDTLEQGLARLKPELGEGRTITIVLDACFSGASQAGPLLESSMAIGTPKLAPTLDGLIRLAAAQADQLAYWDKDAKSGIFTDAFLVGARGAADATPIGNGDGVVTGAELTRFIEDTVSLRARRLHRAIQRPALSGAIEQIRYPMPAAGARSTPPVVVTPPATSTPSPHEVVPPTSEGGAPLGQGDLNLGLSPGQAGIDPAVLAADLQAELSRLGCYTSIIDGEWGPASARAMTAFNAAAKTRFPVGSPTLDALLAARKRTSLDCRPADRFSPTPSRPADGIELFDRPPEPAPGGTGIFLRRPGG